MKRQFFGLSLCLLLVAGRVVSSAPVTIYEPQEKLTVITPQDIVEAADLPVVVAEEQQILEPVVLPIEPEQFKEFAVQAVDNINSFLVLPPEVEDALIMLAQNSDLILQSVKISWDKGLPMLKDMAMDLGPQLREVFHLVTPLAEGNLDGVSKVGDQLFIKAGHIAETIFHYQPRLIELLTELKDSEEASQLKVLVADFAAKRGFGGTINIKNIDYVLAKVIAALQNPKVLTAIHNGIKDLKEPGFWDRTAQKFAPEIKALRRLGQQALTQARAILIDRTGKTPEEWVEVVKQGGNQAITMVEQKTGKSVEELKALAKSKLSEFGDFAQKNIDKVQEQIVAPAA